MVDVILRQRRFYFLFNILPLYRVLLERLIVNRPQHWGLLDHFHRADQDPNIQGGRWVGSALEFWGGVIKST